MYMRGYILRMELHDEVITYYTLSIPDPIGQLSLDGVEQYF